MNYFKSSGFFCLFFVFIFWFLNISLAIFIPDSQLITILIYLGLAVVSLAYLALCKKNIPKTLRLHKMNILSVFLVLVLSVVVRPLTGFFSLLGTISIFLFLASATAHFTILWETVFVNNTSRSGIPIFLFNDEGICVNTFALHLCFLQICLY